MRAVTTFLMFEGQAEEAMRFYTSVFDDGEIVSITRYDDAGPGTPGSVLRAVFTLAGREFMAIDSSVHHAFTFTPSISLFVDCESEDEVDSLAGRLGEGGQVLMPVGEYGFSRRFGWVTDRFGVSWQLNCA
jgi:predicted 3-demethylubiquinone-9 3-methyltransferase (glyoxalase superfamily)